jgi:predicted ester cyclase
VASTSDIARRYFAALSDHDLDQATACWKPGSIDRLVGSRELIAPDGIRAYFDELFAAFPDFELEVVELTTVRHRTAVRWRARGTFAGSDRLGLVSDTLYTLDIQTGRKGGPRVPHPAFDIDVEQARASIRKLAALGPDVAWAGHADPVTGDVRRQLQEAAEAP